MADSGAIRAGKAYVEIGVDNAPLAKGLKASEAETKGWLARLRDSFGDMANFDAIKNQFGTIKDALKENDPMKAAGAILPFLGPFGKAIALAIQFKDVLGGLPGVGGAAFRYLGDAFKETWEGMSNAIKGGDIALAFEILAASLRVIWMDFIDWFAEVCPLIGGIFKDVMTNIGKWFQDTADAISLGFAHMFDFFTGAEGADSMVEDLRREIAGRQWAQANGMVNTPRQDLDELLARARRMVPPEASAIAGARGTFNAAVAPGLVGRVERVSPGEQRIERAANAVRQEVAALREDVRRMRGLEFI
jgi:hypothetical protein